MKQEELPSPVIETSNVGKSRLDIFSSRSLRQFGIYTAGAGLFVASMAITRRSIMRKYHRDIPKFFASSYPANIEVNGAMDALEALNLATINICSVALMTTGGMLWAFDISSLDDVKKRRQMNAIRQADPARSDELSEKVIEDWLTSLFERKEFKALGINTSLITEQLQKKAKSEQTISKEDESPKAINL
ncbi:hypothetical protein OnM2_044003 [Erysiphe neolycopersici]|uniref:Altered inheritance of mitochondria protein 11 n=1 Tax=Erysiphe neolycopersici TaxID=212602 RepID=A0A420HUP3_9PEZI|nr:hypothetical protein OnM2_044003 [Erysiphe neolycopersici]